MFCTRAGKLGGKHNDMDILFVDDDVTALKAARQILGTHFQVAFAADGREAAALLSRADAWAVVVAPMHLEDDAGLPLLTEVGRRSPETVRVLLAYAEELSGAVEFCSREAIFRVLRKPCTPELLISTVRAGLEQHRLLCSEQETLEHTLVATVRTLNDVLSGACPEAFGRAVRVTRVVDHLLRKFPVTAPWRFHVAATLSQLGCVTLEQELVSKAYAGAPLTDVERLRFESHPQRASEILSSIPHFGPVAWMIDQQLQPEIPPFLSEEPGVPIAEIDLGARMLKLAVAFEGLRATVVSEEFIQLRLRGRPAEFSAELVHALSGLGPAETFKDLRRVPTAKLKPGMILNQEIRNRQGLLIIGKGQQVTLSMLFKLENFSRAGSIDKEVMAFVDQ